MGNMRRVKRALVEKSERRKYSGLWRLNIKDAWGRLKLKTIVTEKKRGE